MSKHTLEVCDSLRNAVDSIKERLQKTDKENHEQRKWYTNNMPEQIKKETMEEENWNDKMYLVYRKDNYDDKFYIFEDDHDIQGWLEEKFSDWDLWDYNDPNRFLEEELVIWEFFRDVCKEKWEILYRNSKPFIKGWLRKQEVASMEYSPTFSVG